jgi:hypothetical protein
MEVTATTRKEKNAFYKGATYCSEEHGELYRAEAWSNAMRRTNHRDKAEIVRRMRENNPMRKPGVLELVRQTKQENGTLHRAPPLRGGNGQPVAAPQRTLFECLGPGWVLEFTVGTGKGARARGLASKYSIDIANEEKRIAVEVDGASHQGKTRKAQDKRKDKFLAGRGWRVFRFTNAEVMADSERCAQQVRSST